MPQRKLALRFKSSTDLIAWETERHFKKKGVALLPAVVWDFVILAQFHDQLDGSYGVEGNLQREMRCFRVFFCDEPDLALEVLRFARERCVRHTRGDTRGDTHSKAHRVRWWFLNCGNIFEGRRRKGNRY